MMFVTILALLLSLFSTAVMSYIAMAVPIGPWIEPTVVLVGMIVMMVGARTWSSKVKTHALGLVTAAAGIGGILATGMAFSFPTLYFLDQQLFNRWLADPVRFCSMISALAFTSGGLGLLVADFFESRLINEQSMPFPIGELVYKMIAIHDQTKKALFLGYGFLSTLLALYLRNCTQVIGQTITLVQKISFGFFSFPTIALNVDLIPMFWAVGFVTGHVIAIPLIVGFFARFLCLEPLYKVYVQDVLGIHTFFDTYIIPLFSWIVPSITSFNALTLEDFTIAFCSGIVLYGTIIGFLDFPRFIKTLYRAFRGQAPADKEPSRDKDPRTGGTQSSKLSGVQSIFQKIPVIQTLLVLGANILFLSYCNFSALSQIYLLLFTVVCTYQLMVIAGRIGLAPLGRFATFVMVPFMILFGFDFVQVTFVAAFVEIAGGVACDTLFGRKMAQMASIERKQIAFWQWVGLCVCAVTIGIIFYLLITTFGIGPDAELSVNKAYSRALLINIKNFDVAVLIMGLIFGYLLTFIKVNPTLILGGILMPPAYSLLLVGGGLSTYLCKDKEAQYPWWSGVFAANSLWMIIKTIIGCR